MADGIDETNERENTPDSNKTEYADRLKRGPRPTTQYRTTQTLSVSSQTEGKFSQKHLLEEIELLEMTDHVYGYQSTGRGSFEITFKSHELNHALRSISRKRGDEETFLVKMAVCL